MKISKSPSSLIPAVAVLALFGAGCLGGGSSPATSPSAGTGPETAAVTPAEEDRIPLDIESVSMHSSEEDCWMVIGGAVYDVTEFVASHPGRDTILEGCGKDATSLFETRPMGSGTPHSEDARGMLDAYYLGSLE